MTSDSGFTTRQALRLSTACACLAAWVLLAGCSVTPSVPQPGPDHAAHPEAAATPWSPPATLNITAPVQPPPPMQMDHGAMDHGTMDHSAHGDMGKNDMNMDDMNMDDLHMDSDPAVMHDGHSMHDRKEGAE